MLRLVSSKPEPVTKIKRAWLEGSSLKEERGTGHTERAPHMGMHTVMVRTYYRDSKNRRYVNTAYIDTEYPGGPKVFKEIMD